MGNLGVNYATIIPAIPKKRNGMNCEELKMLHERLMKIIVYYSTPEH